jgi:peptide/nickel transport system ATP-binding protein
MKQRALIALSLVLEPDVLVMDEPTAALDLLMQRSILDLLESIQETYDLTVIFITHDLPLVAGLADRLAVMYAFEFAEIGPADSIISEPAHPYTRSLLNAVPNLDSPLSEMTIVEGSSPDPVDVPSGCSYHPRCPLADQQCTEVDPDYHDVGEDHDAACFHWEESAEAIPLATEKESTREEVEVSATYTGDPLLSMDDVSVHFETEGSGLLSFLRESDTVRAVDDVSLDIYENDVVALVGESGCGKTTLGKTAIAGQRPTSGTVSYREQDVWEANDGASDVDVPFEQIRRSLQIIHQDPGSSLNPNRTVQAILSVPLKRWQSELGLEDRRARILEMLETVGMTPPEDYANRYPHQLSGGEKQRVALIRALLMNPELILADEAVSALDVSLRVEMMDLMLDLQERFDTSFLSISHDLSNARYFAGNADGRIGVMYLGEIVEIGPAEEIVNDPRHPYTKALVWSTPNLDLSEDRGEPPIRGIDIPDPVDPPSGCRFHTRCPDARTYCRNNSPELASDEPGEHSTACFLESDEDHPYWESEPLADDATD